MRKRERDRVNERVIFYPKDPGDNEQLPCVEVAGVQVYVYLHSDGALRISAHYDAGIDPKVWPVHGPCRVPTKVDIGGHIVYSIDRNGRQEVTPA